MAMSGPQHFKEAERLLQKVEYSKNDPENASRLQRAQVHATLALVAATVQGGQLASDRLSEWRMQGMKT
jgi:hypothetical protein